MRWVSRVGAALAAVTFTNPGVQTPFTVPNGVCGYLVTAFGAHGGAGNSGGTGGGTGGAGSSFGTTITPAANGGNGSVILIAISGPCVAPTAATNIQPRFTG